MRREACFAPMKRHRQAHLRTRLATRLLPATLLLLPLSMVYAAPDAGQLLETVKPAATLPPKAASALPADAAPLPALKPSDTPRVRVSGLRISGAKVFADDVLLPLVRDAIGKDLGFDELQALAARITRYYREQGYLLARAYLPAQDLKNGQVEISVLEARLGQRRVQNTSLLSNDQVERHLMDLTSGQALEGRSLERTLLLLSDLPGTEVRSTLQPGASVGTTDLDIKVSPTQRVAGSVGLDNHGNRFTGEYRLSGNLAVNSPFGLGDAASVNAVTAGHGFNYGRLSWQAPVGHDGLQLGAAGSVMRYRLGDDFANLDAHGKAETLGAYGLYPFIRSRAVNFNGQLSADSKRLDDAVDSSATLSRKRVDVATFGLSGDISDAVFGGGLSQWSASFTTGRLRLDAASLALDDAGHQTAGTYSKWSAQFSRIQRLNDGLNAYVQLSGQWANKNLDSSEKMSLGGSSGVRAYPQGEAPADDAVMLNLELRHALTPGWQVSGFIDAAEGRLNHEPLAADTRNKRHLSGVGVGLNGTLPGGVNLQASLAMPTSADATSDTSRSLRAWVQAKKNF